MTKKLVSVCIPTYEMSGLGPEFLAYNFDILLQQTFKDFDVVVSDNSQSDVIKQVCDQYAKKLVVHYYKNNDPAHGMATNINNAMRHASGKLLKLLFLDDFLKSTTSLQETVDAFDFKNDTWLVTGFEHTQDGKAYINPKVPMYNEDVFLGENTIGSPSVLTVKNENLLFFDTNLKWLVDCDYYKRCYDTWGKPKVLSATTVVIRMGAHQVTNTEATVQLRRKEYHYMLKKHLSGIRYWRLKLADSLSYYRKKIRIKRV
jgi:glycosyltransferase involved in cell wall biosynthesis